MRGKGSREGLRNFEDEGGRGYGQRRGGGSLREGEGLKSL